MGSTSLQAAATAAMALALTLAAACSTPSAVGARPVVAPPPTAPPGPPAAPVDGPAVVLGRFVDALQAGRWPQAGGLLSARWRAAYTPQRLAADYAGAGPVGREAAARAAAALAAGTALEVRDGRAVLPVAGGQAVLVAEAGGWRVDALE
jgi:hypothetical protein